VLGERLLEGIERRGIDLLRVEAAELGTDPLPEMQVSIPAAVLHAGRRHVLRIPLAEEHLPAAREEPLAGALLGKQSFGAGLVPSFALTPEARDCEVVLP
jgi:hypothetical protein